MAYDPSNISPRIEDIEPITMECRYELPWERQSNQTACGTTIQYTNGDLNWRIVIEGKITIPQLERLDELRGRDSIEILTAEWGIINVKPDNLVVTRSDDNEVADVDGEVQPWMDFQLQTKQEDEDPAVTFLDES
jgi:hypothetical protein